MTRPKKVLLFILFSFILACSKKVKDIPPEDPLPEHILLYNEASQRLVARFIENGWVVSRNAEGGPEHVGEGLIWAGVALSTLSCEQGTALEDHLIKMIYDQGGALVRYEPLGEYEGGREVTLDGALGLYLGVAYRIAHCAESKLKWQVPIAFHFKFLEANDYHLHLNVGAKLGRPFDYLLDLLRYRLRLLDRMPDVHRFSLLEAALVAWSKGVTATKSACYRINLAWIALQTALELGVEQGETGKAAFCRATKNADIPIIDHYCGRTDIKSYIANFKYDEWEYRHQRCGGWESPDGQGLETPALDLLVALKMAYNL